MKNERYLLSVHIFFIFFTKKTPWWSSTLSREKFLVFRAIVGWGVFVLWIWLADTLLHSTAIRYWGSSILQPRGTGLFRSLGLHCISCLRHWHSCCYKAQMFISLQRNIHKRRVSKEYKFKLSQCSQPSATWEKNCCVTVVLLGHGEEISSHN